MKLSELSEEQRKEMRNIAKVPSDARRYIAQLKRENEDLRLMLYGSTGWDEGEINERLALLAAEESA